LLNFALTGGSFVPSLETVDASFLDNAAAQVQDKST